jgi:hypothetical protein
MKKKPNRKPLPKEQAIYGGCGHRCDLCVHYAGETLARSSAKNCKSVQDAHIV